jgi:glycosyltransferase involved in cell wall biosynthesis
MGRFFVWRNCFTGDKSGGDVHTGGFCAWVHNHHPEHPVALIHAENDGQAKAYPETAQVTELTYKDAGRRTPFAWMFVRRALRASRMRLPYDSSLNMLISGSHFLPDVLPVYRLGNRTKGVTRAVFIHHIVQDMNRPKGLNTTLANLQEQWCFRLIRKRFDKIITVNHAVVEGLRRRGFAQPILVSSNFIDNGGVRPLPFNDKDFTLAFVGRMVKQKGVYTFLKICEQLFANRPDFKAVMIGVGPELDALKIEAAGKGLPITFAGLATNADKFDLLRRSKLFVFPSAEEGWGIVVAESLSVGTPVLAYELPVYKPVFGDNIDVVPLGDEQALIDRAAAMLDAQERDRAGYGKLQQQLVTYTEAFTLDKIAAKEYEFLTGGVTA